MQNDMQLNISKVRWHCRRGVLELDRLLNPFCDRVYPGLPKAKQLIFVSLLNYSDPELLSWLVYQKYLPKDQALLDMIELIRIECMQKV